MTTFSERYGYIKLADALIREKITPEIETEITDPLYELEFETGEVISPMIYTESEWNSRYRVTPFYRNVMMEGKLL